MRGHLRERPKRSGNWYAVIDKRDPSTGKRSRKWLSLEATGKRQAQIECARIISDIKGGIYFEPSKTTMAQFLDRWLEHIKSQVSPRSHERYAEIARKNIVPLIGSVLLTALRPVQISAAYTTALASGRRDGKGGLSPRTVHHMHWILRQALSQAVRWEMLARNPADAVDAPKADPRPMKTYDMAQTAELIEATRPTRMFIPTILGALCGLRRGEIAALRWRHVDLDIGSLSVAQSAEQTTKGVRYKEPKSGKARTVQLSATVIEELKAWRLKQAEELLRLGARPGSETFVVTQTDGSPLQPRSITHEWVRLLATKRLPRIRFHDLRHTHATHLLAAGVHPKIASERLGHSKIGITLDLYSHVMPGMQEDAVALVDAAFQAALQTQRGKKG
jgi:integrase